ncbi:unnamed protein product [Lupinus luteus]|uniref:Uncharacterized protein n=1 Tax=Lupinus luteus TaxID=3873 RepID=A0AAV1WKU0_LUPLU
MLSGGFISKVLINGDLIFVRMEEFLVDPFVGCGDESLCASRVSHNLSPPLAALGDNDNESWLDRSSCWGEQVLLEDDSVEVIEVVADSMNQIADWVGYALPNSNRISPMTCFERAQHVPCVVSTLDFLSSCWDVQKLVQDEVIEVYVVERVCSFKSANGSVEDSVRCVDEAPLNPTLESAME